MDACEPPNVDLASLAFSHLRPALNHTPHLVLTTAQQHPDLEKHLHTRWSITTISKPLKF